METVFYYYQWFCTVFATGFIILLIKGIIEAYAKEKSDKRTQAMQEIKKAFQTIKFVYIESENDTFIMYDYASNRFLCQGKTEDDLWAEAKARYPKLELIIVPIGKNTVDTPLN